MAIPSIQLEKHVYQAEKSGPTLVVTARIHGNEPSGEIAARCIIDELNSGQLALTHGKLIVFPLLNPFAKEKNVRGIWIDTNRALTTRARDHDAILTPEHGLRASLVDELKSIGFLQGAPRRRWHLLDLHSVPKDGKPHTILSEGRNDLAFAQAIGAPSIYSGWRTAQLKVTEDDLRALGHTREQHKNFTSALIYAARDCGATSAVCLESGQDDDPASVKWAYRGIRNALSFFGLANDVRSPVEPKHFTHTVFDQVLIRRDESERLVNISHDAQSVRPGQIILLGATREVTVPKENRSWQIAHPIDAQVGRHCGFLAYQL